MMDEDFKCEVCGGRTLRFSTQFGLCCATCGFNPFKSVDKRTDKISKKNNHKKKRVNKQTKKSDRNNSSKIKKQLNIKDVKSLIKGFECFADSVLKFFEAIYRIFGFLFLIVVEGLKVLYKLNDKNNKKKNKGTKK